MAISMWTIRVWHLREKLHTFIGQKSIQTIKNNLFDCVESGIWNNYRFLSANYDKCTSRTSFNRDYNLTVRLYSFVKLSLGQILHSVFRNDWPVNHRSSFPNFNWNFVSAIFRMPLCHISFDQYLSDFFFFFLLYEIRV